MMATCSYDSPIRFDVTAIIKKEWTGSMSAASVSAEEFLFLYDEASIYSSAPYQLLEEVFQKYCPDFVVPKKWSNLTRLARTMVKKGKNASTIFSSSNPMPKDNFIGPYCSRLQINENSLKLPCPVSVLTVGAFREICLFKNKICATWFDVKNWITNLLPWSDSTPQFSEKKIIYTFNTIQNKFLFYSKRGLKYESESLLCLDFTSYVNLNKNKTSNVFKPHKSVETKLLLKNVQLRNDIVQLDNENHVLHKIIEETQSQTKNLEKKVLELKSHSDENKRLQTQLDKAKKNLKSVKRENFYKRLKRREWNVQKKENRVNNKICVLKQKLQESEEQRKMQNHKIEELKNRKRVLCKNLHCKSNQLCYIKNAYVKNKSMLCQKRKELENEKQLNINLKRLNEQIVQQNNNIPVIDTKCNGGRYSDEIRTCVLELSSLDVSSNKIPDVIKSVSNNLFDQNLTTPCKSTVQNIIAEGNLLSKQQVGEEILKSKNWGLFSDGTSRQGKKIIDIGIHTDDNTFTLGYTPVACEDSATVSNVLKDSINDTASQVADSGLNANNSTEIKNKFLSSLTTLMSDRSSVMKKSNSIIDEWRTNILKNSISSDEINLLEFFYCSAHVLLGFHSEIEKKAMQLYKSSEPLGRDCDKKFCGFKNNEPPSFRVIRMACECLGPNGDEKNGVRQQWLAYCKMRNKKSFIQSYRGNRFNNIFEEARHVLFHIDDIVDLLSNHIENPNMKLQSILLDLKCSTIFNHVVCLAALGSYITLPFWDLINSDQNYVELFKFFQPLNDKCKAWSENCSEVFNGEVDPILPSFPHKLDELFNNLLLNVRKCDQQGQTFFSMLSHCVSVVIERQLYDHLPGGKYGSQPDNKLIASTSHSKITNIPAEHLFGDLDYAIKRKRNASLFHHSSIVMLKRNKTTSWLKKKSEYEKKKLMAGARKKAKEILEKHKKIEQNVMLNRQEVLRQVKLNRLKKQKKEETELKRIENSIKKMGGIVKSVSDIDNLLSLSKSLKGKKEKLRDQLLYLKHFMNKDIDRKHFFVTSNTVIQLKKSLIKFLELDKEKTISVGTWVAVAYQNDWYPGEVIKISENIFTVNYMRPRKAHTNAFVWPTQNDTKDIERKFIFFSHFDIMPTSGLRFYIIPDYDDIQTLYSEYCAKYF